MLQSCSGRCHSGVYYDLSDSDDQRLIDVEWDYKEKATFISELQIKALDRPKLLQDLTALYAEAKLNAISLNLRINKDRVAIVDIGFEINETKQIEDLIKRINLIF